MGKTWSFSSERIHRLRLKTESQHLSRSRGIYKAAFRGVSAACEFTRGGRGGGSERDGKTERCERRGERRGADSPVDRRAGEADAVAACPDGRK